MFLGTFFYLSLLIGSLITWVLLPKYSMFLVFLMFVLIFIVSSISSFLAMKKTTITYTLDKEEKQRTKDIILYIQRKNTTFFQCGKIVSYYTLTRNNQIIKQDKTINTTMEQEVLLSIEHCGIYDLCIYQEQYYDLLHSVFYKRKQAISKTIVILPIDTHNIELLQTSKVTNDDQVVQYVKGDDTSEIFELRNYQEGDLLKHIHWKASMKKQEMLVKVGSTPLSSRIYIGYLVYPDANNTDQMLDHLHTVCTRLNEAHSIYDIGIYDVETNQIDIKTIIDTNTYMTTMYEILSRVDVSYTSEQLQNSGQGKSMYCIQKEGIVLLNGEGGHEYEKTILP